MSNGRERRTARRSALLRMLAVCLGLLVLTLWDQQLWQWATIDPKRELRGKDWFQVLRQFGGLPVWAIVGAALVMHDARLGNAWRRGGFVFLCAMLSGGAAELLKVAVRRQRPEPDGLYRFGWFEDVGSLGLASSHASVAFGGALMLSHFFPRTRLLLIAVAMGTCATRLVEGAHFATDVYAGVVLAWAVYALLTHRMRGGSGRP
jgi:membrane-associated phospholipid phosphatase